VTEVQRFTVQRFRWLKMNFVNYEAILFMRQSNRLKSGERPEGWKARMLGGDIGNMDQKHKFPSFLAYSLPSFQAFQPFKA
jgi:hypothetical protein